MTTSKKRAATAHRPGRRPGRSAGRLAATIVAAAIGASLAGTDARAGDDARDDAVAWIAKANKFGPKTPIVDDMTAAFEDALAVDKQIVLRFGSGLMKSGKGSFAGIWNRNFFSVELSDEQDAALGGGPMGVTNTTAGKIRPRRKRSLLILSDLVIRDAERMPGRTPVTGTVRFERKRKVDEPVVILLSYPRNEQTTIIDRFEVPAGDLSARKGTITFGFSPMNIDGEQRAGPQLVLIEAATEPEGDREKTEIVSGNVLAAVVTVDPDAGDGGARPPAGGGAARPPAGGGADPAAAVAALEKLGARVDREEGRVIGVAFDEPSPETLAKAGDHLRALRSLRSLDLGFGVEADGAQHLAGLDQIEQIQGVTVDDRSAEYLGTMRNLRELGYGAASGISDAGLSHLGKLTRLTRLNLTESRVTDEGLRHLAGMKELDTLELALTGVGGAGLSHLRGLPALRELNLAGTRVDAGGLRHVAGLPGLEALNLAEAPIGDDAIAALAGAGKLHTLSIAGCARVTGRGLEKLPALEALSAEESGLDDEGLAALGGARALTSLTAWKTKVTDAGVGHLRGARALRNLDLSETELTGKGLEALAACADLADVRLIGAPIGDAGLGFVKAWKQADGVFLNLANTKVSDAGLKHFAGTNGFYSLTFSGTDVSDAGLRHLEGMSKLRALTVDGTKVTANGVAKLKKKLPDCDILAE